MSMYEFWHYLETGGKKGHHNNETALHFWRRDQQRWVKRCRYIHIRLVYIHFQGSTGR